MASSMAARISFGARTDNTLRSRSAVITAPKGLNTFANWLTSAYLTWKILTGQFWGMPDESLRSVLESSCASVSGTAASNEISARPASKNLGFTLTSILIDQPVNDYLWIIGDELH